MVVKRYPALLIALLTLTLDTPAADSAQCLDKTCVDVFTSDNQLVITAQKGSSKPVVKKPATKPKPVVPVVKPSPKPTLIFLPKPSPKPATKKVASKPKPAVPKAAKPKIVTASLSDRLTKLLPTGDINFQPQEQALVNLPVYFWTKTPERFTALVPILDVLVYVNLTPTFTWSFGDGATQISKLSGAPYPIGPINHTYTNSQDYSVGLMISWQGYWSVNGITTPITGNAITQSVSRTLSVVKGPTKFTK